MLGNDFAVSVTPTGHYLGPPGVEEHLTHIVHLDTGEQLTLTPAEYTQRFGWKNEPTKVPKLKRLRPIVSQDDKMTITRHGARSYSSLHGHECDRCADSRARYLVACEKRSRPLRVVSSAVIEFGGGWIGVANVALNVFKVGSIFKGGCDERGSHRVGGVAASQAGASGVFVNDAVDFVGRNCAARIAMAVVAPHGTE